MTYENRVQNLKGRPASMIVGDVRVWTEAHKHALQDAAVIGREADAEVARLRDTVEELNKELDAVKAERDRLRQAGDTLADRVEQCCFRDAIAVWDEACAVPTEETKP